MPLAGVHPRAPGGGMLVLGGFCPSDCGGAPGGGMPAGNHQRWQMSARRSDAETRGADKSCGGSAGAEHMPEVYVK